MKKLICLLLALMMVLSMVACGNETEEVAVDETKVAYDEAVVAYNAGSYAEAIEMLTALGDYEDAAQLLASISVEISGAAVEMVAAEGTATAEVEYVFQNGNMSKEVFTYADGASVKNYYKYDDEGECTSETLNDLEGGKTTISHLYMDGVKTRTLRTNPDKTKDTYVYTCDANGMVIRHVLTLADGTTEEATYSYNDQGLLSMISSTTGTTTYEYDAHGNMLNETVTVNGEIISAVTYTYNYIYSVG